MCSHVVWFVFFFLRLNTNKQEILWKVKINQGDNGRAVYCTGNHIISWILSWLWFYRKLMWPNFGNYIGAEVWWLTVFQRWFVENNRSNLNRTQMLNSWILQLWLVLLECPRFSHNDPILMCGWGFDEKQTSSYNPHVAIIRVKVLNALRLLILLTMIFLFLLLIFLHNLQLWYIQLYTSNSTILLLIINWI